MSETIQQRLEAIRGQLTQQVFAEKLGNKGKNANKLVSQTETGRARPTDEYLKKVAEKFGQSLDELLMLRERSHYAPPPARGEMSLNDRSSEPSKEATLRMLENERREFAAALAWMIERDSKKGSDFAKDVWDSNLSATAKHLLLGAALREQERRAHAGAQKN